MKKLLWNSAHLVFLFASVLFNLGCGVFSPAAPPLTATSVKGISPTAISAGSDAFTLTVTGQSFNSRDMVVWNGIILATNLRGSTTARAIVPATAVANPGTAQVAMWDSKTGRTCDAVTFTVTHAPSFPTPEVSVSVTPTSTSLLTGGTQQFTATVANTTNAAVTWSVASGGGTISTSGLYTAPSTTGTVTVVATSVAAPSASALAYVTVALSGSGTAVQHSVTLTWQGSTASARSYNVYRSETSGGPYAKLNPVVDPNNTFVDSSVQSGYTYYYVITGVDSAGLESRYSDQVTAVIPTP